MTAHQCKRKGHLGRIFGNRLGCGGEGYGEEAVGILPGVGGFEAGAGQEFFYGGGSELVAVFGVDGLALCEGQGEGWPGGVCGDVDALGDCRFEVHLDAGLDVVPEGLLAEGGGVEVGSEIAVETVEDVAVEGGGSAGGVVVGGEEGGLVFVGAGAEIGAKQKNVAGQELVVAKSFPMQSSMAIWGLVSSGLPGVVGLGASLLKEMVRSM